MGRGSNGRTGEFFESCNNIQCLLWSQLGYDLAFIGVSEAYK